MHLVEPTRPSHQVGEEHVHTQERSPDLRRQRATRTAAEQPTQADRSQLKDEDAFVMKLAEYYLPYDG